jgi:ElaB/YqjD/DUF883 family membrane-anchored ribosome-binding protein
MHATLTRKLKQDLQTVVTDTEDLLKATASQTGEGIDRIRARAEESLRSVRIRLSEAGTASSERVRAAANSADHQMHEHPYVAAGVAAGIGLLAGLLIARR